MVELGLSRLYSDVILSASAFCIFGSMNELRDEHSTGGVSVLPRQIMKNILKKCIVHAISFGQQIKKNIKLKYLKIIYYNQYYE